MTVSASNSTLRQALVPAPPQWSAWPAVSVTQVAEVGADRVTLETSAGHLDITLHACGARLRFGGVRTPDYGLLVAEPAAERLEASSDGEFTVIRSATHELLVRHTPFAFELTCERRPIARSGRDGHFTREFRLPPCAFDGDGWLVNLDLQANEPVYGLGEKWGALNRRGQLLHSHNEDALGVNAESSYKNCPFAWSPRGWGVFVHTPAPVVHSVGHAQWSQRSYTLVVQDAHLDLWLLSGETPQAQLRDYTALTGRAPTPPPWSLGAILSRAYYRTPAEVIATAREVRAQGMPCDVITLDGRAWQDTQTRFTFDWDPARFGDGGVSPSALLKTLRRLDFRVCLWEYPLVSVHNPLFEEMADHGWFLEHAQTGKPYRYQWDPEPFGNTLTPLPESGLIDFTHPEAYAYWRERHAELFALGVDMLKPDFGEQVTPDMRASNGERGEALHNVYAHLYNRCVHEAGQRYGGERGCFLFSRAGWIGSQRFPSQWGGDPQADWGGLAASLRGGLSWGMTGAPYFATDVGGFYGDQRDPELYVRWLQAGVFSAHLRLHGIGAREPWSYGAQAQAAAMKMLHLRYALVPYLYRCLEQSTRSGLPVQRSMVLACPEEPQAWAFDGQFFCGENLLVAPCLQSGGEVGVYLPAGEWVRFPAGERVTGGRFVEQRLALDEVAVFARAGARIPLAQGLQHVTAEATTPARWWTASP